MLISPAIADAPANHRIRMRADVVDGAERLAEVLVRQVGQRAAVGLAARLELLGRDEHGGDEAGREQVHAT